MVYITMKKISIFVLLVLCATLLFCENKDFTFSSDRTSISLAEGREQTTLTGNAYISSEDTEITADSIELYGEDFRFARCNGKVLVVDSNQGIRINTESLFFDRKKEIMIITGYAEMIDQKNEIVVKGSYFENRGKENITIIQIGVRILKASDNDVMTCRSEYAKYNRDDESLELAGMPVVFWKDDEYSASRITINLETDDINLTGEVSGTIRSEEDSSEAAETTETDGITDEQ
jgi:lipopolysaccharide export system protein LptA